MTTFNPDHVTKVREELNDVASINVKLTQEFDDLVSSMRRTGIISFDETVDIVMELQAELERVRNLFNSLKYNLALISSNETTEGK